MSRLASRLEGEPISGVIWQARRVAVQGCGSRTSDPGTTTTSAPPVPLRGVQIDVDTVSDLGWFACAGRPLLGLRQELQRIVGNRAIAAATMLRGAAPQAGTRHAGGHGQPAARRHGPRPELSRAS